LITQLEPLSIVEQTHQYINQQDQQKILFASQQAHQLLAVILSQLTVGMTELDAEALTEKILQESAIVERWHKPYVRFNQNTCLTCYDRRTAIATLTEDAIAFIDIGPVIGGIEADAGNTVVFGDDAEKHRLVAVAKQLFDFGVAYWRENNPTGVALYNAIKQEATQQGVVFNLNPAGHLIGQFPHQGWKKGLCHWEEPILSGGWILEIQIQSIAGSYGAFYEALLVESA
jgi:methionine aminopeptidase